MDAGLDGLRDEPWPGAQRTVTDADFEAVIVMTSKNNPPAALLDVVAVTVARSRSLCYRGIGWQSPDDHPRQPERRADNMQGDKSPDYENERSPHHRFNVNQVDVAPTGIDRRSALKKVAVGGAVAWTAPMVLSSRVSAQTACTLKCAPTGTFTVTVVLRVLPCDPDVEPGNQPVRGEIVSVSTTGGTCGCGGSPVPSADLSRIPNGVVIIRDRPGNDAVTFDVPIIITCLDRQGNLVRIICTVTFTTGQPGNCQSRGNRNETYIEVASCQAPAC